ncbi:ubiquinone anaerobic biosynthesis accessory factor UbiT [Pseudomonas nitroreducens]|uniref:ubiquinone anaerobic biosynthesis accessory factor UbiT n=1 Tax=Pseudomonas nitroreducens TaxID=46680 RepID=UPI002A0EF851|nr:putative lipid carrier protein YhbT [Pseudomonas nitroreducens]
MLTLETGALRAADRLLPLAARMPAGLQRAVLQRAANRLFAEPLADGAFDVLDGHWLRLEVSDLGLAWSFTHDRSGLRFADACTPSVTIRGSWRDFLLLAGRQEDPDTLFFRRRLVIEGDTELGLAVKNLIDSLDPDSLPTWLWNAMRRASRVVQENA